MKETRLERLRPDEIVAEMGEVPLVYFPLGPLEWHGPHLPLGTDFLNVHRIACPFRALSRRKITTCTLHRRAGYRLGA